MNTQARSVAATIVAALVTAIAPGLGAQNPPVRSASGQNTERPSLPNRDRTIENFVTMPSGRVMGSTNAINVDAKGNIWVFERCGAGKFVFPHGLEFDKDGNVWVVDAGVVDGVKGNQIVKYAPDGRILLELGKPGVRGATPALFNEPSDLVIAPAHAVSITLLQPRDHHSGARGLSTSG